MNAEGKAGRAEERVTSSWRWTRIIGGLFVAGSIIGGVIAGVFGLAM